MAINRELSQFANFLDINDSNQTIGIATTATPYVGFGTTNPTTKVQVVGGLTADYFYGDGSNLQGVISGIGIATEGGIVGYGVTLLNVFGSGVSGTQYNENLGIATITFSGGGAGGGSAGVGINSLGTVIGTGVTILNFIGTGNTFSYNPSTNTVDISIAGGGGGGGGTNIITVLSRTGFGITVSAPNGTLTIYGRYTNTNVSI